MKLHEKTAKRKGLAAILAAIAVGATAAAAVAVSLPKSTASATSTDPAVTVSEIFDSSTGRFNQTNLNTLYQKMGGSSVTSVSALKNKIPATGNKLYTAADIRTNGGSDIIVEFGGQKWSVTGATVTKTGDVVATLWLAYTPNEDAYKCQWNTWYDYYSADKKYPSNMYSTSKVRSYLNGTNYATSATSANSQSQNETWEEFILNYSPFLATPSQIAYQETESSAATLQYSASNQYNFPNDAYGTPSAGTFYYNEDNMLSLDYSEKEGYSSWANDYLWLPSFTETGYNNSNGTASTGNAGLWNLSSSQRQNSYYSWLRSGYNFYAYNPYDLSSSGNYGNGSVGSTYCVRPALHLNLSSAALSAAGSLPEASKIAQKPKLGAAEKYFTGSWEYFEITGYNAGKMSYDYTYTCDYWDSEPCCDEMSNSVLMPNSVMATDITVTISLNSGVQWVGGGNENVVFTVKLLPYEINVDWGGLEYTYDGTAKKPIAAGGGYITIPNGVKLYMQTSYTQSGAAVTDPVNAGSYGVKAELYNHNGNDDTHDYIESVNLVGGDTTFIINPKPIEPVWDTSAYVYNSVAQAPAATAQGVSGALSLAYVYKNSSGNTISKPSAAGAYTVTASESSGNYVLYGATQGFTISPKAVAVEWSNLQLPYSGSAQKPTATVSTGISGVSLALTVTASGINAGEYTATASLSSANANFTLLNASTKYYIVKADPTVTVSVTGTSGLKVGMDMPSISLSSGSTAGTISWTDGVLVQGQNTYGWLFVPTNSNYNVKTGSYQLTVAAADAVVLSSIAVEFAQVGEIFANTTDLESKINYTVYAVYSDGTRSQITSGYTATPNLAQSKITFSYQGKDTDITVYVTPKAVVSVTAVYSGSSLTDEQSVADIDKSQLTVTAHYNDKTESVIPASGYTLSGVLKAGVCPIIVTADGNTAIFNVTVTAHGVSKVVVTVQWEADSLSFVYDGKAKKPVAYYVINGTDKVLLDITVSGAKAIAGKAVNAGAYTATVDVSTLNSRYELTGELTKTFNITRREAAVAWSFDAATYDGKAHLPVATVTADFLDAQATYEITKNGEKVDFAVDAGDYVITISYNDNYDVSSTEYDFTIGKAKITSLAYDKIDEKKYFETADAVKNYIQNIFGGNSNINIDVSENNGKFVATVSHTDTVNYETASYSFKIGVQPNNGGSTTGSPDLMLILLCVGVGMVFIMAMLALILAIRHRKMNVRANDDDGFYDDYTGDDI